MPKDSKGGFHMNAQRAMAADKQHAAPPAAPPAMDDQMGGMSIMEDPEAMQCIELLQSKGYTADQVIEAMNEGSEMGGEMPPMHQGY